VAVVTSSAPKIEAPPRLPRKFGPFLLFDVIGKGGMAEIFLARAETELGGLRLCVVKQIIPSLVAHRQFAEMLIHEAKLAARLDHANIVKVIDLGRADGELYIAMEYVEGFDLTDLLRRCTKQKVAMPLDFALAIICAVLRGLDYAHRRTSDGGLPLGIVHRDVSPSNVLVSYEGEIKLCDFGIARANELVLGEKPEVAARDALQGKAGYMSPEHARGEDIDARADVFAAGILMWELLTGRRMYQKDAGPSLLEQARLAEIPPLSQRGLVHEDRLHAIARKALAPAREDRYASAAAMLREVEAYMSEAGLAPSPLKLGAWLESSFGTDIVTRRRMRQRAAEALEKGPPVVLKPIDMLPPPPQPPGVTSRGPRAIESSPTSIDAATVDVVGSRPDVSAVASETLAVRRRSTWIGLVIAAIALALAAYVYAFRGS
jgi:eukaryotic-like serine/threonine-protein kinase